MMRSRSCWNAGRTSSSVSARRRPRESALLAACGASSSRSRASRASRMLDNNFLQEADAVREGTDTEIAGDGLTQVGEGAARAQVLAALHSGASQQKWHVFTRVVGTRGGRVVAVIG